MSRICEILAEKAVLTGNRVSHSNRKTKRRFLPNLQNVTIISDVLAKHFRMRISTKTIRSIDANGGLDAYLLTTKNDDLTEKAKQLKKAIKSAINKKEQI